MKKFVIISVIVLSACMVPITAASAKTSKPSTTCRAALSASDEMMSQTGGVMGSVAVFFQSLSDNAHANASSYLVFVQQLTDDVSTFNSDITDAKDSLMSVITDYKNKRDLCLAGK